MTDEQWLLIEPLLPNRAPQRGGRWVDHRVIIDAVAWRQSTGRPWRELPGRFGPWQTAYHRYTVWGRDGTWHRIRDRLQGRPGRTDDLTWLATLTDPTDPTDPTEPSQSAAQAVVGRGSDGAASPVALSRRVGRANTSVSVFRSARSIPRTRPPVGATPPGS